LPKRIQMRYLVVITCIILFTRCNNNADKGPTSTIKTDSTVRDNNSVYKSGIDIEPSLRFIDSLEVIYYDNPDGDSLRYSRFYQYLPSNRTIHSNLEQAFETRNSSMNCRSEGKIYLYRELEPVKTVYFSTRCDTCCYIYFIKDGAFLYFPLSDNLKRSLKENKANSKRP